MEEIIEGEVLINSFSTPRDDGDGLVNVSIRADRLSLLDKNIVNLG